MTRALIWAALYKRRRYPIIKASARGYWSRTEGSTHLDQLCVDFFPASLHPLRPSTRGQPFTVTLKSNDVLVILRLQHSSCSMLAETLVRRHRGC